MLSISKFSELAKDVSLTGRRNLVTALCDLFVSSDPDQGEQVSVMFGEIVMHVLDDLEEETRMILAQRVGVHRAAPHELVVDLAKDDISVAQPVLSQSDVLTSEDLVEIAGQGSMDHLLAIAERDHIDESVSEVLVERGNDSVLVAVAGNEGAKMAAQTFDQLVDKARASEDIQAALIHRKDIPQSAAETLVSFLADELRKRVAELDVDSSLVSMLSERGVSEVAARVGRVSSSREELLNLVEAAEQGKGSIENVIRELVRADKPAEIAITLAKVNGLPSAAVAKLLYGKSDKPAVILCKACELPKDVFMQIMTLRAKRVQMSGEDLRNSLARYQAFSHASAIKMLEAMRPQTG
ncbi:MAG: DUF2336 domain-containing protein [Rhodobacteraceae bacterium]|nr:DUF2336 domain-containing protein [Paracoccaceae bacterium]